MRQPSSLRLGRAFYIFFILVLAIANSAVAEPDLKLPLAVDGPAGAQTFEAPGPAASVLTGFLLPSSGPLTAWAPVFSSYGADGGLTGSQDGQWVGPRPSKWIRIVRAGSVVAGFRVLVRTAPGVVQTRQMQIFWVGWNDGAPQGKPVDSRVYGAPAGEKDQVRIVELRLPEGTVPTGLWGQVAGGSVLQTSLLVRRTNSPPAPAGPKGSQTTAPDRLPGFIQAPTVPTAPSAPLLK